jgi:predicted AAA+ superfamily ATPase
VPGFRLDRPNTTAPGHYRRTRPLLASYVGEYLREEVFAESLTRNLPAFQRFLEMAAFSNGQVVNFAAMARDVGMSSPTIRGYFEILTDTLLGSWLPAWRKRAKRRVVESPRFYLFDVGLAYWRTSSGLEVDFILGDAAVAVEAKATENPTSDHLRGLRAFRGEQTVRRAILVCRAPRARITDDGIEVLPWKVFLEQLWAGELNVI